MRDIVERFFEKVIISETGCWLWTASTRKVGYGQFNNGTRTPIAAHRWSYIFFKGKIPTGLELDHVCQKKACVNPSHLEAVTHRENLLRRPYSDRAKPCPQGHKREGMSGNGKIYCLICNRDRERKRAGWTKLQIKMLPTIPSKMSKKKVRSVLQNLRDYGTAIFTNGE